METFLISILSVICGLAYGAQTNTFNSDKPSRLYVASDTQELNTTTNQGWDGVPSYDQHGDFNFHWNVSNHYDHTWQDGVGGQGFKKYVDIGWHVNSHPYTNTTTATLIWTNNGDGVEIDVGYDGTISTNWIGQPMIANEHCAVHDPMSAAPYTIYPWVEPNGAVFTNTFTYSETYDRTAQTKWRLETGGKALSGRVKLWNLSGSAAELLNKRATPFYVGVPTRPITANTLTINGHVLSDAGDYWTVLPDGTNIDVTPYAAGKDFYIFDVETQAFQPYISANGSRLDPDAINVTNCVGQKIVFQLQFDPPLPNGELAATNNNWWLPPEYVNAKRWFNTNDLGYYITTCDPEQTWLDDYENISSPACTFYRQEVWPLAQPETGAWWVSGGLKAVTCFPVLTLNNGQNVSLGSVRGDFDVLKPQITRVDTSMGPYGSQLQTNSLPYTLWLNGGPMDFQVYISKTFPGKFGITQLVNMYSETSIGISTVWTSTGNDYYLDKAQEFYEAETPVTNLVTYPSDDEFGIGSRIYDTPAQTLGIIEADYTGHWKDYVRFTPDGNDSIPITLGRIDWNWAATALADPHWYITSDPSGVDGPTLHADDDSFPTWTKTFPNGD